MANRIIVQATEAELPFEIFLGDNENTIEIQILIAMLANLLHTPVKSKIKHSQAFSDLVSVVRQQLMNYINTYRFLEDPEGSWLELIKKNKLSNLTVPRIGEA